MNVTIKKYVIASKKIDSSEIKFFSIDTSSGYPYWSPFINSAKTYEYPPEFLDQISGCNYMVEHVEEVYIGEIFINVVEVINIKDTEKIKLEKRKEELRKKIEEAELELNSLK